MMNQMHSNANTELAKDYISKRKIPQLFEVKKKKTNGNFNDQILSLGFDHGSDGS